MAPITGYIQIQFIANYPTNNLYWRIGAGPYTGPILIDCTPVFGPFVPGSTCTYTISPITFDFETCDEITYNGYIEATCNTDGPSGYLNWSKTFVPSPECTPVTLTCIGENITGQVSGFSITNPGNYGFEPNLPSIQNCVDLTLSITDPQAPGTTICGSFHGRHLASSCSSSVPYYCYCIYKPIITIAPPPPGGTQATAEAVMGYGGLYKPALVVNGGIGSPTLTQTFYAVPCDTPTNYIPMPIPAPPIQGVGTQKFDVTVTNGVVTSVVPTLYPNQGSGFYQDEFFSFDPALIGGVIGVLCRPSLGSVDLGMIIAVEVTNPGSGYPQFPVAAVAIDSLEAHCDLTINFEGQITAIIGNGLGACPPFDPGNNCLDQPYMDGAGMIPSLPVNTSLQICYKDIPVSIPLSYSITPAVGCCYDCLQVRVEPDIFQPLPLIIYTECTNFEIIVYQMVNYTPITINCVVNDSWYSSQNSTVFNILGPCIT